MKYVALIALVTISLSFSKHSSTWREKTEKAEFLHRTVKAVTDVMVHDIYSPPVASRTYAYISIAGYETIIAGGNEYKSLAAQLHSLNPVPKPDKSKEYSYTIAAVHSVLAVAKTMVISEKDIDSFHTKILNEIKGSGIPADVLANSLEYGQLVAKHIIAWASLDNYKQTRTFSKYAVNNNIQSWKPTPPAYMRAVEPHWNKVRTFLMDSAQQFKPFPATAFSADKQSQFYKEALDVYEAGMKLTEEQKHIASFWDCNPFKMNVNGHVMYASKKISPGGHWMNITGLACREKNLTPSQTMEAYACLAVTIADAFISCWDEKYRSQVIRPETYINKYIDGSWLPLLQTPPFPEYTSGHSVISTAAAVMLEKIFGPNFSFTDSTELEFGIPVRHFKSFTHAAEEAAISRFYGGIHYMPAIVNGSEEGGRLGRFFVQKLNTKN